MNVNDVYGGSFLKAADLQGRTVQVQISAVSLETFDNDEKKLAVHFVGKDKALITNKTNAAMIAASYTEETDNWIGKVIELHAEKVGFQGKIVDALRVRIPAPAAVAQPAAAPASPSQEFQQPAAEYEDDIPF